jgi:hypothetical protein
VLYDCIKVMILRMSKLLWPKPFPVVNQHVRFGSFAKPFNEVLIFFATPRVVEQAGNCGIDDDVDGDFART